MLKWLFVLAAVFLVAYFFVNVAILIWLALAAFSIAYVVTDFEFDS